MIDQRKKAQFLVEPDSFSEKDITRSVISKLRPGFPSEFRHMAQYGRKPGMRGRLTYFYSKVIVSNSLCLTVKFIEITRWDLL